MNITRRLAISAIVGAAALAAAPVMALSVEAAKSHVQATVGDITRVLNNAGGGPVRPTELQQVMSRRANIPAIARFVAGRSWRDMSPAQQQEYVNAFSHYVSVTYAKRFNDFSGTPTITVGRAIDAGRKGILVETPIVMPNGKRYMIEWLVSDRGGQTEIVDLVVEQVSLAATQRDEVGAMLDRRGGDVDALIAALRETR